VTSNAVRAKPSLRARVRHVLRDDRGSVSAEFAMTLPAVAATVVLCVAAVALSTQQLSLTAVAHQLVRLEARGESLQDSEFAAKVSAFAQSRTRTGDALCLTLRAKRGHGPLSAIPITARACALISA